MKRLVIWKTAGLFLALLAAVAGCAPDNKEPDRQPVTPTQAVVGWQRPQQVIQQDTFSQVELSGIMRLHQQTVNDVAFSLSGTRMASVGADNYVSVWNLANGESQFVKTESDGRRVFFGPEDTMLYTLNRDGLIRVWDIRMGPPRELVEITNFPGHDTAAGIFVQSVDRSLLALGGSDGGISLWRLPENELVFRFKAHAGAMQALALSSDGRWLASIGSDLKVRVWSVPAGEQVYDLSDKDLIPQRVVFSPDSSRLAATYVSGIRVWDMENGEALYFSTTVDNAVGSALAFSPDGGLLAACGSNPTAGVWDIKTGELLGGLAMPDRGCRTLLFSPDSSLVLTVPIPGRDVYLWDISHITDDVPPEEKQLRRRDRQNMGLIPDTQFYNAAWSDDGRFIIVIDELGPMYALSATAN